MSDQVINRGSFKTLYSEESEQAVIGAVLVSPALFVTIAANLKADDFFLLRHRYIWQALNALQERNEPVDYLTVSEQLKAMGKYEDIGGGATLTNMISQTPTHVHGVVYGKLVERFAIRRRLMSAADQIKAAALNEEMLLEDVINQSGKLLFDSTQFSTQDKTVAFGDALSEYFEVVDKQVEARRNGEIIPSGLLTGFDQIDMLLQGMRPNELIILGARPGMGKSSLLLSIAMNILRKDAKKRILFNSLEMSTEQIIQRAISLESGVNLRNLRSGNVTTPEWQRFVKASGDIHGYGLFINDQSSLTPMQLESTIRRMIMAGNKPDLVMVDYLQLMSGDKSFKASERVQEVSYITRKLKEISGEYDVPVFAAAQLSRACEERKDKRPMLSDLRESGSQEQDADVVMFLYRDDYYNPDSEFPNQAEIIVAKQRNGPTGTANLYFEKTLTKFMNASNRYVDLSTI